MNAEVYPDRNEGQENDEGGVLEHLEREGLRADLVIELKEPFFDGVLNRVRRRRKGQLTKNFNLIEFYCKDGTRPLPGRWRTYKALCRQYLEPMRKKFGRCRVNSGYRTKTWNARVGGESGSYHVNDWHDVDDVAADVTFERGTPLQWAAEARRLRESRRAGKGGIGTYVRSRFVHVDTRDYASNWTG